jgi:putative addiction module component (TIGR02574 family)
MGDAARKLRDAALALPDDERELLALDLLASLQRPEPGWEEAWSREIERRIDDVRSGRVASIPWDEARRGILAKLTRP